MTGYDYELQTKMADYFANFVKTGDPNGDGLVKWIPYTKGRHKAMDIGRFFLVKRDFFEKYGTRCICLPHFGHLMVTASIYGR